jgi:hypothetical protein
MSIELDNQYRVEIVNSLEQFMLLKETWNELLVEYTSYVPFLCHEWFELWLKHFLKGSELFIIVLYQKNNVVGVAPLLRKQEKFKRLYKVKKIELIGNIVSPVRGFIFADFDSKKRTEHYLALLSFLKKYDDWDIFELDAFYDPIISFSALKRIIVQAGINNDCYHCFNYYYLDEIPETGNLYLTSRSKKLRDNLRRYRKRLEDKGSISVEIVSNPENTPRCVDLHYRIRENSWKNPDEKSAFHRDLFKFASLKGWLRCCIFMFDKKPIASQIRFVHNRHAYFISTMYDIAYKKYSPGNLLLAETAKYLIDTDKVVEMNYLYGDEDYKKEWLEKKAERNGLVLFNRNMCGIFSAFLTMKVIPIYRKFKDFNCSPSRRKDFT